MRLNGALKLVLACLIALLLTVAGPASLMGPASAGNGSSDNDVDQENTAETDIGGGGQSQSGDDTSDTVQSGGSASGDAVAGQVFGSVSAGDVSGDATNRSSDVDVESGASAAFNTADNFVGQAASGDAGENTQAGDNELDLTQRADATSGDAVGGQVIGVVTAAGGSADIVAANISDDVDISTGDALSTNDSEIFVGLLILGSIGDLSIMQRNTASFTDSDDNVLTQTNDATVSLAGGANTQEGDNEASLTQSANSTSGDGVGGQVIGVVSAGDSSVDATNRSSDVDIDTGDAESTNASLAFVGLLAGGEVGDVSVIQVNDAEFDDADANTVNQSNLAIIDVAGASNDQTGDNSFDHSQAADVTSGDGVGGQVIGVVTSSGGSSDVVAANASEDVDVSSGDADSTNFSDVFVGLLGAGETGDIVVDQENITDIVDGDNNVVDQSNEAMITVFGTANTQDGDNEFDGTQGAGAASGDGVAGQVIGVVSAGVTSVDATNSSSDVDTGTGDAESSNGTEAFVGLLLESFGGDVVIGQSNTGTITGADELELDQGNSAVDVEIGSSAINHEVGDNQYEVGQSSSASTGDGVGGQVLGVVTASGGTADVVVANESADIDLDSGESQQDNDGDSFVGLQIAAEFGDFIIDQSNSATISE